MFFFVGKMWRPLFGFSARSIYIFIWLLKSLDDWRPGNYSTPKSTTKCPLGSRLHSNLGILNLNWTGLSWISGLCFVFWVCVLSVLFTVVVVGFVDDLVLVLVVVVFLFFYCLDRAVILFIYFSSSKFKFHSHSPSYVLANSNSHSSHSVSYHLSSLWQTLFLTICFPQSLSWL